MKVKKVVSIILVIVWMSIVFSFSNQQGESSGNTSRKVSEIIVNIIDFQNKYTDEQKEGLVKTIEPVIRKLAHYTIYAIGGIIIANCVYQFYNKEKTLIGISTIIGVLYAVSDELHQLMVDGRSGNIKDVIIDSLGIITGIIFFLLVKEIISKVVNKKNTIRG
ncbi:MAG: VanZ family protein [Clostridia bacterium]|nr:VanZ family protein [Clostridia bacterium]